MSHVDDGTLHALVDNELDAAERSAVEAHLASCGDCARRFAEATAMARQVVTLFGALDAPAPAVRVAPSPAVVLAPPGVVHPAARMRARFFTLQRVAVAASVLLVAGVSYEVGKRRDSSVELAATPESVQLPSAAVRLRAVPSVVDAVPDSFVAAAPPSVRQQPRGGPRNDSDVAVSERSAPTSRKAANAAAPAVAMPLSTPLPVVASVSVAPDAAEQRQRDSVTASRSADEALGRVQAQEQAGAKQGVPAPQGPARMRMEPRLEQVVVTGSASPATAASQSAPAKRTVPKTVPLQGYTAVEDESVPAMTRRRYVSPSGTALILSIAQSTDAEKVAGARDAATEFVVTTENGRSSVRWRARGLDYELEGALAPDSLVKLATKLKP